MALRDLLTALEEEGAAEHERAQQDRRRQAAQLLADAQERAAKIHQDVVIAAETAARQEAEDLLITARFRARRAVRTARDGALEEVLGQVREQLLFLALLETVYDLTLMFQLKGTQEVDLPQIRRCHGFAPETSV